MYFERCYHYPDTYAIWVTDGTQEGTHEVSLPTNIVSAYPLGAGTSYLYCVARDDAGTTTLWRTDETPEGTLNLGTFDGAFEDFPTSSWYHVAVTVGNRLFFRVISPEKSVENVGELWCTDGTPESTIKLFTFAFAEVDPEGYHRVFNPGWLTAFNGKVLFSGYNDAYGIEPWVSDGTPAGTHMLKDLYSEVPGYPECPANNFSSLPQEFKIYEDLPHFHTYSCVYDVDTETTFSERVTPNLWQTDGTAEGTVPVAIAPDAWKIVTLENLTVYSNSDGLWSIPNAGGEPTQLASFWDEPSDFTGIFLLTELNGKVVFVGRTFIDCEPWITDGTVEGTTILKNINLDYGSIEKSKEYDLYESEAFVKEGEYLYFYADDGIHGQEIWRTDGTFDGTRKVTDLDPEIPYIPESGMSMGKGLTLFQHRLFFISKDELGQRQLWSLDLTHFDLACAPAEEGESEGIGEGEDEGGSEGETEGAAMEGEGTAEGQPQEGEGISEGEGQADHHSADQNDDGIINLSELLRVIQFFNSNGLHCETGTEDGYAPGPSGDASCIPHASDYTPQDWIIGLSELLRLIQFFNSGGYHVCAGSEDGFCPGS